MILNPTFKGIVTTFVLAILLSFSFTNLKAYSNTAIVPLKITVEGKLVITEAENDTTSGKDPTIDVLLKLSPSLENTVVSGSSGIRIRTNLKSWKLTAQRSTNEVNSLNINPKDISLSFSTKAGSKGNLHAAELISPFNEITALNKISSDSPTEILIGKDKTSGLKDPENLENWFQLTSTYSAVPDFFYNEGEFNTVISYSLVSP